MFRPHSPKRDLFPLSWRDTLTTLLRGAKADAEWLINMVENLLSITRMEGARGGPPH